MPAFPVLDKQQRAGATDVTLSWNMMAIRVALAPQRRPNAAKDTATRYVCPDQHDKPTPVTEQLVCPDGHAHTRSEMLTAREMEDGTLVIVDKTVKTEAVTGGQEEKELNLVAVPRDQLDRWTRPDEVAHRVRLEKKPSTTDRKLYRAYLELAADPEIVLVGTMVISGKRRMFSVERWNDQLLLQSRIETADLAPPDAVGDLLPAADDPEMTTLVSRLREAVGALTVDFDPDEFRHDAKAALDKVAASIASGDTPAVTTAGEAGSADDLLGALDGLIAQAKPAKKPAAKKAAAKAEAA